MYFKLSYAFIVFGWLLLYFKFVRLAIVEPFFVVLLIFASPPNRCS